jgi:aspartate-semialdehyde dehydrogenase
VEEIVKVLESYQPEACRLKLHSAPEKTINVCDMATDPFRPQPRLDLMVGGGYSVSIGRLRRGKLSHLQFTLLVHNTILGAAGSSIMNAELAIQKGLLK